MASSVVVVTSYVVFQIYVLRLDSTLSKASYKYDISEVTFAADSSYKHFTFNFTAMVSLNLDNDRQSKGCQCRSYVINRYNVVCTYVCMYVYVHISAHTQGLGKMHL